VGLAFLHESTTQAPFFFFLFYLPGVTAKNFSRMDAETGYPCAFEKAGLAKPQLSQLQQYQ
jgi:hypothetical protein